MKIQQLQKAVPDFYSLCKMRRQEPILLTHALIRFCYLYLHKIINSFKISAEIISCINNFFNCGNSNIFIADIPNFIFPFSASKCNEGLFTSGGRTSIFSLRQSSRNFVTLSVFSNSFLSSPLKTPQDNVLLDKLFDMQ